MNKKLLIYMIVFASVFITLIAQNQQEEKYKLAESYEKSGDFLNASRLYQELYESNKNNIQVFDALVRSLKAQNKFSDLLPLTEENIQLRKNPAAYSLNAEILWKLGRNNDANKSWTEGQNIEKNNPVTYSTIAGSQITCRLYEKAISTFLAGRETLNVPNVFSDELSQLYIMTSDYKSATREILLMFEYSRNIYIAQGRFSAVLGNKDASDYIYKILSEKSNSSGNTDYKRLFAWLLRSLSKFDEAFAVTREFDELVKAKGFEILQFANTSFKDEQYDIALKAYEYVVDQGRATPYMMNGLWGFARTLEAKIQQKGTIPAEEIKDIIKRYQKIKKDFPNTPTAEDCSIRIAYLYSELLDDKENSMKELKELLSSNQRRPVMATALNMLADIYFQQDNLKEYEASLKIIMTNYRNIAPSDFIQSQYKMYELEYFTGNSDSAQAHFVEMMNSTGSDAANDALERIVLLETNKSLTLGLKNFAQAEKLEKQKRFQEAIEKYKETNSTADYSDLAERSHVKMSKILYNQKKFSEAETVLDSLLSKYPKTIFADNAYYNIGLCQLGMGNNDKALQTFTDFLGRYPRSIYIDEVRDKIRKLRKAA